MQIKPNDGVSPARLTSTRPAAGAQLAPPETRLNAAQVSLSTSVRTLATALTSELLDLHELQLGELTGADRALLAQVSELARAQELDAGEVVKLALDLSRYRAADAARGAPPALLELPMFSPRDEGLARTILASVALRSSALELGFVRTLLDPDQSHEHAVDFAFVRRVVVALSGAPGNDVRDPSVTFEHREARATLARAIAALALPRAELPAALAEHAELGASLVRRYLPAALARTPADPPSDGSALTRNDRALLSVLYAAAHARGQDPSSVDDVARALLGLRRLERAAAGDQTEPELETRLPVPHDRSPRPGAPVRSAPERVTPRAPDAAPPAPEAARQAAAGRPADGAPPAAAARPADPAPSAPAARPADPAPSAPAATPADPAPSAPAARPAAPAPPAPEAAPSTPEAARPADAARPAFEGAGADRFDLPARARSFGSAAHLAARAGGTYRSLAPASPIAGGVPVSESAALPSGTPGATPVRFAAPPPLDLVGALGLGALIRDLRARSLRARLSARRANLVRPIEPPARAEADADDPMLEDSRARKRVRWRLLLSRRRRGRPGG